ncbi:centromere-associated protein E [Chanos chanos]|uniref:Centromere-associated protein E n=1 Tax=Chanos chanos TaxID=29144 RepID=A0A6J2WA09_CHACN|nr:centromere-associated protein E [Chanos chanos]
MTEESAVKVCVRVRPLIEREESAAETADAVQVYWKTEKQAIQQIDDGNLTKTFNFDRVFSAEETTKQLYQEIAKPLVVSTVEGYNGTIFAYGQTSSGKTFTMMGDKTSPGVIPLAMEDVFQTIKNCPKKEFLLRVSYMEIYNETVTDLLCDSWKRKPLEIREGNYKNVYVADLTEELVTSPDQALAWIRKGEKNRHYGKTKMNQRSSRSHTIFRMILESRERSDPASGENADGAIIVSHLNLVDLAGAERASQTGAEGTRFKEGCNINRSLFTLGQVIKKLSDESQKGFTNYRDSKLTRILQNSLGGNAKTVIICTITPATVEETLSTLQFASAAKRMKNDPHVTEVSDDGALLRRYRNEISDLKRRLHEVSSVTQTTVTEKETLCQLLQEKDQLQREQEDRIRNLTKLLVTASNVVQVKKVPKRRVTWGGKLLRASQFLEMHHEVTEHSFVAEPSFKKSALLEQGEYMEEFDGRWDIPEEQTFDTEMNQSNVAMRGSSDNDFPCSPQLSELSDKVACLELQLESEIQQKQEAMDRNDSLEKRVAELEQQLQASTQDQEKQETIERNDSLEKRVAELEEQLQASTQDQEKQECRKDLEETIQFCETLGFERESIAAERDLLKQSLELLTEQIEKLKHDSEVLQKEIDERKDMEEFKSLEEESKKEYERELLAEISTLRQVSKDSRDQVQKLEADLAAMTTELKKKEDFASELQKFSDKDLVQEITKLRRSLDDAERLSLETKRDWAFLRSENLSLKERDETLTADYERMQSELKALQSQLEKEKSHFKKMQADLQKELLDAFDENTKLTALLDGKVPKNLVDSVTLEKTVADLKKELKRSQEREMAVQSKIEDLKSLEHLPDKVNELTKQVCELTGELCSVHKEREELVSTQADSDEKVRELQEEIQRAQEQLVELRNNLSIAEQKEGCLNQQQTETSEQLAKLQADLEHCSAENTRLLDSLDQANLKSTQLVEELEVLRDERDQLLSERSEGALNQNEELQKLHSNVTSLTEERDQLQEILQALREERNQLKTDLEENIEMMIENQDELRGALEKIKEQQDKIQSLEKEKALLDTKLSSHEDDIPQKELQAQMKQLLEELQCVRDERDQLLSEKDKHSLDKTEELERMCSNITSLTEERDQLQEMLQGLREERSQLKRDLEENMEMLGQVQSELKQQDFSCEQQAQLQTQLLDGELEALREENIQLREDLQKRADMIIETESQLHSIQEELRQQHKLNCDLKTESTSRESQLEQQVKQLNEELELVRSERDQLQSEDKGSTRSDMAEMEKLLSTITSLTEERDQLQEILQAVREEKNQLKTDLEENIEMNIEVQAELKQQQQENSEQQTQAHHQIQQLERELETLREEKSQLSTDLQEKVEMMRQLNEELQAVRSKMDQSPSDTTDCSRSDSVEVEKLLSSIASLTEERDQLQEILQAVREEKNQLKTDLEENIEMAVQIQAELKQQQQLVSEKQTLEEQTQLSVQQLTLEVEALQNERSQLRTELDDKTQKMTQLKEELELVQSESDQLNSKNNDCTNSDTTEMEKLLSTITSLTEERDQIQEILQAVREERNQLKKDLEENVEMVIEVQGELRQQQALNSELQSRREETEDQLQQIQMLREELEAVKEDRTQLKRELQGNAETLKVNQDLLSTIQEELKQQQQENSELKTQSAAKESHLEQQMGQLSEEVLTLRNERDRLLLEKSSDQNLSTELQRLQSTLTSLTEEKKQIEQTLEDVRNVGLQWKSDLQQSVETRELLNKELESLRDEKSQAALTNSEKLEELQSNVTSLTEQKDQLWEILQGEREQRNQLKKELDENMKKLKQLGERVQDLEMEKLRLLSEADTMRQSLVEASTTISMLKDQITVAANQRGAQMVSELESTNKSLQTSFLKFQMFIDNPTLRNSYKDMLSREWPLAELLAFVPKAQRMLYVNFQKKTNELSDALQKTEYTLRKLAQCHKSLFEAQVQRDVESFEEKRLQDLLIHRAQDPSQPLMLFQDCFQHVWDQGMTELLEKRKQYLQKMNRVLEGLEDDLTKHTITVSVERREQERLMEEFRVLSRSQDSAAVLQFFEKELVRRSIATVHQRQVFERLRDEYGSCFSVLDSCTAESRHRLKEQRSESLALLRTQEGASPKTQADLLQDNHRLGLQLQQAQRDRQVTQQKLEDLQEQAGLSKQKEDAGLKQLQSQLREKEDIIQNLQEKLRETEALAKRKAAPSAVELETLKDKLVKMELDNIALSTSHQNEITQMRSVLEHREEVIRKLKETLRKAQQDEHSFLEGEDFSFKAVTQSRGHTGIKEKRIEEEVKELQKKNAKFESLVSSQQQEIAKWKHRAYKLRECRKDLKETPQSPRTPTKRPNPLLESEVNSPKKGFLDSPKSKFFDVRSGADSMSIKCPKQFFDNSSLGTMPEVSCAPLEPATESSESDQEEASSRGEKKDDDWFKSVLSPREANACPTQ